MLPVLRGVRCDADWCDEQVSLLLWGIVLGGLVGLGRRTIITGLQRVIHRRSTQQLWQDRCATSFLRRLVT